MDERSNLEQIATQYRNQDLLGLNELYHLAMRDQMIASDGGEPALKSAAGQDREHAFSVNVTGESMW